MFFPPLRKPVQVDVYTYYVGYIIILWRRHRRQYRICWRGNDDEIVHYYIFIYAIVSPHYKHIIYSFIYLLSWCTTLFPGSLKKKMQVYNVILIINIFSFIQFRYYNVLYSNKKIVLTFMKYCAVPNILFESYLLS